MMFRSEAIPNGLARNDLAVVVPFAALTGMAAGGILISIAVALSPLYAAAVISGLLIATLVLIYPELGFLFVALVVPLERMGRFNDDNSATSISLIRFIGVMALGAFLLHALMKRWKLKSGSAVIIYSIYTVFGIMTVLFSNDRLGGVRTAGQVVGNLTFLYLVVNIVRNWRIAKAGIVIWLLASVLAGIYTIYGWHFGTDRIVGENSVGTTAERFQATYSDSSAWDGLDVVGRAMGPTSHPAVYGLNLIFTLPFWPWLYRTYNNGIIRGTVVASFLIIIYNIFLTNTRATIILAAVILVMIPLRGLIAVRPGFLVALLLAGAGSLYFVPADVYTRVLNVSNYFQGKSTGTFKLRMQFWQAGFDVAQEHLLFGVGMGNQLAVPSAVRGVSPERISAHNEYLNTVLEVGIIGFALLFATVAVILRASFRAALLFRKVGGCNERYWFMIACQLCLVSALLYSVQADVFHFPLKGWWLVAGVSIALHDVAVQELQNGPEEAS
jgi:O-antigen ligase